MKKGMLRILGACATAFAFALPASAVTVSLQVVGQDLKVIANVGSDTVTAWDVGITFNNALLTDITGYDTDNQLGLSNVDTVFGASAAAGLIDAFEISFLTNAEIDAIQATDPITLMTVHFDAAADMSMGNFGLVPFDAATQYVVDCASGATGTVVCVPGSNQAIPEPASAALVGLALVVGAGVSRRRRLFA